MPEEVFPGIFRIEVPLPKNPLRSVNSYVILGEDRDLVLDTGMNREDCKAALLSGLRELSIDLSRTDVLVTHMHADHLGLASELTQGRTKASLLFERGKVENRCYGLLLRFTDKRAGVDDDYVGRAEIIGYRIACLSKEVEYAFAVDLVFSASEILKGDFGHGSLPFDIAQDKLGLRVN